MVTPDAPLPPEPVKSNPTVGSDEAPQGLRTWTATTFASLSNRNFRLFFAGQFISQIGTWLSMVTQTLFVLRLTTSGLTLGLLVACQFGPVLVLGPLGGAASDRMDKQRLLLATQTAAMVQSLVLAAAVATDVASLPVVFALAAVQGTITAFDNPTRRAFVVEMVEPDQVTNAVSLNTTMMTGSRVFGPALAGVVLGAVGFARTFLLDGLSYIAVLAALLAMRRSELHPAPPAPRAKGQIRSGLAYARCETNIWVPLVMCLIIGTFAFNFSVTIPLLVTETLGGADTTFTLLFSILSLGSVAGALWTARRSSVPPRQVVLAAVAFGVTMLALAASPNLVAAIPAAVALGAASVTFMTSATAIVQLTAKAEFRGRVLALQAMVFLGSTPIGGPIIGKIIDVGGPRAGIAVGGLACLVAAAWGRAQFRDAFGDDVMADPDPPPPVHAVDCAEAAP
jgi:MFS family permease